MNKRGILLLAIIFSLGLVYAATFSDLTQSDFSGTYANTTHNSTGVILSGTNSSGTYTSRIFDAVYLSNWNNLSYSYSTPVIEILYSVDNSAGIWQSTDSGTSWNQISLDYNPSQGNIGAVNILFNSSGSLFVANTQSLWKSDDSGVSWSLANSDVNGAGDSNDVVAMTIHENTIYLIDGSEDVLKSTDSGASFTKVNSTDFNNGNGGVKALVSNGSGTLFAVDAQADVWKSENSGVSWILVKDDYNNGDSNGATDMKSDGSNLFILYLQDLWKSTDSGVSWIKINDDFNNGDTGNGQAIVIDSNNYFYIADGSEDIYKSTDSGASFVRTIENFNGGDGLIKGLDSFVYSTNLTFYVRNCSQSDCSDSSWQDFDLNNINLTSRYFQYKIDFTSQDSSITSILYNISLDYTILDNTSPTLSIISPLNTNYVIDVTQLSYIIYDANLQACWYSLNSGITNTTIACGNNISGLTSNQGSNTWKVWANDSLGNLNSSSVTFSKDTIIPTLSIISPLNTNYSTNSILVNISAEDTNLQSTWFDNSTTNINYSEGYYTFPQGTNTIIAYTNDSFGNLNSSSITFYIDSIAPSVSIILPQSGASYGYNTSLALNFSAYDSGIGIESCWYNLGAENISIPSCNNLTFNVSTNGDYTLTLFANDSLGNQNSDFSTFTIQLGAPSITLSSPISVYLNYSSITFKYTPSDLDLQACELWGDFTGEFKLNQTELSPTNYSENYFYLNLSDRTYLWNIKCNDSQGNFAFNGNKTFYVDTTSPTLSLQQPSGSKTSRTIPLAFSVNDTNLDSCWYNVYFGVNSEILNASINCSQTSSTFLVNLDANFIINFYANDSANNINYVNSSFTVDTSTIVTPPVVTPGGGGGGGGGGITSNFSFSGIQLSVSDIIINPGESKKLSASIKNTGTKFLNSCRLSGAGDYASWISSNEIKSLAVGEIYEFIFTLNTPQELKPGSYNIGVLIKCLETSISKNFLAEMIEKKIEVSITKTEKISENKLKVSYLLSEPSGVTQNVNISIVLLGNTNEKISETSRRLGIEPNTNINLEDTLDIPADLVGDFSILISVSSDSFSTFAQESLLLGKSSISGFSIFGVSGTGGLIVLVLVIAFSVFVVIVVIRIIILRNQVKNEKRSYHTHLHEAMKKLEHRGVKVAK